MPDIWAIIVIVIIVMIIYGYVSSKLADIKKRKLREQSIPEIADQLKLGISYNVYLSDGRCFESIRIIGAIEGDDDEFSFAGWDGMLILQKANEKKVYLKKSSIRFVEET